jgi:hypothetical protein
MRIARGCRVAETRLDAHANVLRIDHCLVAAARVLSGALAGQAFIPWHGDGTEQENIDYPSASETSARDPGRRSI